VGEGVDPVKKIALGVLGLVALAAAAVFFLRSSDEEKIDQLLKTCAEAAANGDADGILRHLDPSCTLGDQPYPVLCDRIRGAVAQAKGMRIDLGSAISVNGEEGFVTLRVKVHALQHELGEALVSLRLRNAGGEWKFVRVDETAR
jgi:hypothetical protein